MTRPATPPPPSAYTDVYGLFFEDLGGCPRVPDTSRIPALLELVEQTVFSDAVSTVRPARRS